MAKIFKRYTGLILIFVFLITGCGKKAEKKPLPYLVPCEAESIRDLYREALYEDILIVYTVTTRAAETKESFEAAYPGVYVEVRDLRSPNLVEEVEKDYQTGHYECDVVICTDNSGDFKERLVDTGILAPYIPEDIASHMKAGMYGDTVTFVNEAEMLFYNSGKYDSCPISNIWELTEDKFAGRIYMPNPLRSFSTFAFCASTFEKASELKEARKRYDGTDVSGSKAAEEFWTLASKNIVFTNSSDEVMEALGNGTADFGILVSSKMRFKSIGYNMEPVYRLDPFVGCRTSYSVMLAANSKNKSAAKLFIRFVLGEADGKSGGITPFTTVGTWSARTDIADATPVPMEEIDLIIPDTGKIISDRDKIEKFWIETLKNSVTE